MNGSIDHLPAFSVDPPGVLVLTRHWDGDETWLTVKRADPQVEFSDELLTEFFSGGDNDGMYPDVWLQLQPHDTDNCPDDREKCFYNALVRIGGRDRCVVYRIGEYVAKRNSWIARWPD